MLISGNMVLISGKKSLVYLTSMSFLVCTKSPACMR